MPTKPKPKPKTKRKPPATPPAPPAAAAPEKSTAEKIKEQLEAIERAKQAARKYANPAGGGYEGHKQRTAERQREQSHISNDILPFPECVDLKIVERCEKDFGLFCKTILAPWFPLPFSADHKKVIPKIEESAIDGGLFALGMPRGSGKTALSMAAAIWAKLYRLRRYVGLFGPTGPHAIRMLNTIKKEYRGNDRMLEHYPLVCHPIRRLEGKSIRAATQHAGGAPTAIVWTEKKIVLPTVQGSRSSGAILYAAGITGEIRGPVESTSDGTLVRPDFCIVDDFQTRESAFSELQCTTRESIIMADILEMAGPGVKMCGVLLCTVIRKGDAADRFLDRKVHPEFRGERMKALYSMPTNMDWWEKYAEHYKQSLEEEDKSGKCNALYEKERAIADEGAEVAWPERIKPGDLSALQSLMHVRITKPEVFDSEFQNEPKLNIAADDLTPAQIAGKLNRLDQRIVPNDAAIATAFIDVQKNLLYYVVTAWSDGFTGSIVDYGTWPDTGRAWFKLSQIDRNLLKNATNMANLEEQLYAGMDKLTRQLLGREWQSESGGVARLKLCLIDGNWPESTNVVYQFCRQSPFAATLMPSRGHFYGAKSKPISDKPKKDGVRRGLEWEIPPAVAGRPTRHLHWDTNFWKSFVNARLAAPMGSRGCLSLFGTDPRAHRMLSEQLTAEFRVHVEVPGRAVDEWQQKAGEDNHWFDCLVGCAVAASVCGIGMEGVHASNKPRQEVDYLELYKQAKKT